MSAPRSCSRARARSTRFIQVYISGGRRRGVTCVSFFRHHLVRYISKQAQNRDRHASNKYPCDVSGSVGQGIHTGVATIRTNSHRIRTWFAQIRTWFAEGSHRFAQQSQHSPEIHEIRANSHLVRTVATFARIRTESHGVALPSHAVALRSHGFAQDSHRIRTKFTKIHTLFSPILTGRTCELVTRTHHVSHSALAPRR